MKRFLMTTVVAGAMLVPALASADDVRWRFTSGFDYSAGKYGEPVSTAVYLVPLTAKALVGNWSFRLTTNFLSISGPADIVVLDGNGGGETGGSGSGGVDPTGGTAPVRSRTGWGDTTLAAGYTFRDIGTSPFYIDLGAQLRLPTGNSGQGLGTGAIDEVVNAEVGGDWDFGGAYISAGRRFLGDVRGFAREDGWQGSVGGWLYLAKYYELGVYYDYRNAVSKALPDPKDVGLYLSYKLAPAWKVQLDASKGLSSGSATRDLAIYVTYRPDEGYR